VYLHLRVIKSCLIWTSLCMLFEVVTIGLHYMTDRQERFDLKISKFKVLRKLSKINFKVNYPFKT